MDKSNFIYFKDVEKILKNNMFYGFTAKRDGNKIQYTYHCIRYHKIIIKVLSMKLDPKNVKSDKIVLGIKLNDKELNGWNDFIYNLKNIYNINKKLKYEKN